MFAEECRRAIMAAPRSGLDALAKAVWQAYGADALSEAEASELCELVASSPGHTLSSSGAPQARRLAAAVIGQHGAPKGLDGLRMASAGHRSTVHDGRGRGDRRHRGRDREARPVRALHRRHRGPGRGLRNDRPQRPPAGQIARAVARRDPARGP